MILQAAHSIPSPSMKPLPAAKRASGVHLPANTTASQLYHHLLYVTSVNFGLKGLDLGIPEDPAQFKREMGRIIPTFEARRVTSDYRVDIAQLLSQRSFEEMRFVSQDREVPLSEHIATRGEPLQTTRFAMEGQPGYYPTITYGTSAGGQALQELLEDFQRRGWQTPEAFEAMNRVIQQSMTAKESLDLAERKERYVLLGGAQLSPADALLKGGAEVLWIDIAEPTRYLDRPQDWAGALHVPDDGANLLEQPRDIAATIEKFAEDGPVHIGCFAYADGDMREWRLTAAMNAIVRSLDPSMIKSLTHYVSPTTATSTHPDDARRAAQRDGNLPHGMGLWKSIEKLKTHIPGIGKKFQAKWFQGGQFSVGNYHGMYSLVPVMQGASYQAAQHIEKTLAAEAFHDGGIERVSSNVLPISGTQSMMAGKAGPLFARAFKGAPHLDVLISDPEMTRVLGALMMFDDILSEQGPDLLSYRRKQFHGGVYNLPYELEGMVEFAWALGYLPPTIASSIAAPLRLDGRA